MTAILGLITNSAFWSFLGSLIGLGCQLFSTFLAAKKAADEKKETFNMDQAKFNKMVADTIQLQIDQQPGQSHGAGNAWDQTDPQKKDGKI